MNRFRTAARMAGQIRQSSTSTATSPIYRLVTVNPKPERAAHVASLVAAHLKDTRGLTLQHIGNIESEGEVAAKVTDLKPDILFCASLWTATESTRIIKTATSTLPTLKTHAVPFGLHNTGGPDAVVSHLVDTIGSLLEIK